MSGDAESTITTRWLLYNKFTFLHSSAFVGLFKHFRYVISAWNIEYTKHLKDTLFRNLGLIVFNFVSSEKKGLHYKY